MPECLYYTNSVAGTRMTSILLRITQYIVYYAVLGFEFFGPLVLAWYGLSKLLGFGFLLGVLDAIVLIVWVLLWLFLWAFSGGEQPLFQRF
jgi:Na+/H+-dicarboxylate symporter